MTNQEIKSQVLNILKNSKAEFAGYRHGQVKSIKLNKTDKESGYIAIFYKQCEVFETFKGQDIRPVEIFNYSLEENWDGEEEMNIDLHFDCNGQDEEWIQKKNEKMSDAEFFNFWI